MMIRHPHNVYNHTYLVFSTRVKQILMDRFPNFGGKTIRKKRLRNHLATGSNYPLATVSILYVLSVEYQATQGS